MRPDPRNARGAGPGHASRLLPAQAVIRVPAVVPEHQNARTVCGVLENQVIRKRTEVGAAETRTGDGMKSLGIFLDGGRQCLEFFLETYGDFQPRLFLVVAQSATEVLRDKRMKAQSHRRATTASPPVLLLPGSSPPQGSDPFQHSCGWPRRGRRHRRRGPLGASSVSAKPGKRGCCPGVSSPPARCRLTFAYLNITSRPWSGKRFWFPERLASSTLWGTTRRNVSQGGGVLLCVARWGEELRPLTSGRLWRRTAHFPERHLSFLVLRSRCLNPNCPAAWWTGTITRESAG